MLIHTCPQRCSRPPTPQLSARDHRPTREDAAGEEPPAVSTTTASFAAEAIPSDAFDAAGARTGRPLPPFVGITGTAPETPACWRLPVRIAEGDPHAGLVRAAHGGGRAAGGRWPPGRP